MQGIKKIIKYVGFPFLILGILIGVIVIIQINLFRPINFDVKELCNGPDCKVFIAEMEQKVFDITNYSEEEVRLAQEEVERYKRLYNDKEKEKSIALKSREVMKDLLVEAYPTEFYCYTDKRDEIIEFDYEGHSVEEKRYTINNLYILDNYDFDSCGVCYLDDEYSVVCGNEYWDEYRYTRSCYDCSDDASKCNREEIVKETVVKVNKTMYLKLNKDEVSLVNIPENLSFEQKIELTKELKKHDCYASKMVEESSLIEDEDLNTDYLIMYPIQMGNFTVELSIS